MLKKISIILIVLMLFITIVFFAPYENLSKISKVSSPCEFELVDKKFIFDGFECFDSYYSSKNKVFAQNNGISETEAFIIGNLGKYWAKNLLEGRKVFLKENDIQYYKYSYLEKFKYSGFCIKNGKVCNKDSFDFQINKIRAANYKVLDLNTDEVYEINDENVRLLKNYLVLRKSHLPQKDKNKKFFVINEDPISINKPSMNYKNNNIKVFLSDFTTKLIPNRNCTTDMCKEIVSNIDNAKQTIDIAIYGYSRVPAIENALENALNRGVKVRLVYDSDAKGDNIYPDTKRLASLIKNNSSDVKSLEVGNIMHNKFYIFDDKILITGSANLAHTDMSGYNTNSMIVLNSYEASKIYKSEFEQMYAGKYHNSKSKTQNHIISGTITAYFSPQDKSITNVVVPMIRRAEKYIYIPTFVLTEKRLAEELINAYNHGIDVRIITDALNASTKHTKVYELRKAGVPVKIENYAGKMHSKSIIIDDKEVVIGSMNFSNSGENKNDENILLIKDAKLAEFYKTFFLYQWNKIDNKWLQYNPKAEGRDSIGSCSDGLDNDYDGLIDTEDTGCK